MNLSIFSFSIFYNFDFKKFLKNYFFYLAVLSALTFILNYAYIKITAGDEDTDKFRSVPYNIKICNFGSSHGNASFNYQDFQDGFNFALGSQSLSYDLRILKYYFDHLANDGTAFIDISYFSFFGKQETQIFDFISKNRRYYKFLDANSIKLYDALIDFYVNKFPVLIAYKNIFKAFAGIDLHEKPRETAETLDLKAHAIARYQAHIIENKFDANGKRIYNQEEIGALYEIIKLLKSKNITPVLITTPYMSEYADTTREKSPEFFDDFYGIINKVCADTGVKYYDYSRDERFKYDRTLFSDTDHLNKAGAKKFTNIVISELIK